MVATKLSEVAAKGYGWAYGGSTETPPATPLRNTNNHNGNSSSSFSSPSALWEVASSSLSTAADQAYNTLAGVADYSPWSWGESVGKADPETTSSLSSAPHANALSSSSSSSSWLQNLVDRNHPFASSLNIHNPYNRVRGRYAQNYSSLSAVRSLLPLVEGTADQYHPLLTTDIIHNDETATAEGELLLTGESEEGVRSLGSSRDGDAPTTTDPPSSIRQASQVHRNSETASQLAEGTVRALRDIALDEAVELYSALRFWSERWEHPLLSWFEAGPTVWFSPDGYDHQLVGQKVAQVQAVLARRCVAIGELQQHLLRAGWQRGVAQWGVLGQGGQWATVQGTYVMTEATAALSKRTLDEGPRSLERIGMNNIPPRSTTTTGSGKPAKKSDRKKWKREKGYYASVFVRNENDGKILMDDAALAEWSVDAMALIRDLLRRASNGKAGLPYEHHWHPTPLVLYSTKRRPEQLSSLYSDSEQGDLIVEEALKPPSQTNSTASQVQEGLDSRQLPIWARWASKTAMGDSYEYEPHDSPTHSSEDGNVVISNLKLMAAEVSELLDAIENIMALQKSRRIRKLKPPSMFRRRWYLTIVAAPGLTYLAHYLFMKGYGSKVIRVTLSKIHQFFQERVVVPFVAIIEEVWKGREDISDKKARIEVIAGLKEMIRSWLEDNHPEIPAAERLIMAENMDISLIERKKAESLRNLFELNQAVRLSFIEMQFIKKEMVNALSTMDDMMTKNEINTNLAAVTPAVLLLYTAKQVFRFFYYALLKLGKSKEETYATFRQILTDIERLLVMRDNPPSSPFPNHHNARHLAGDTEEASQSQMFHGDRPFSRSDVLSADDLGMLMLHIHECRTILWRDHSRFTSGITLSVSEDLAELAGERGAVSVQQQLQIIARMCRTYPFLKVISIGTTFHERFIS